MRGFSKAIITGNLTRDPELRTTPNGTNVCSFSVAVNRVYRDSNGEQKSAVSYIDCSAWSRLGEMINQYARKGSAVLVSGRLDQHSWEDKTDGKKRSHVEIVVEDFNFVGSASRDNEPSSFGMKRDSEAPIDDDSAAAEGGVPEDIPEGEIDLSEVPF